MSLSYRNRIRRQTRRVRRLLDLYCGAFGAGYGYLAAGFDEVVGIDIKRRRDLPDGVTFIKGNVLEYLQDLDFLRSFDAVHASAPCQLFTRCGHLRDAQGKTTTKLNLIPQTRDALDLAGVPYVLENVEGAPLRNDLLLCGSMFPELHVDDATGRRWLKRHRVFESNVPLISAGRCRHKEAGVRPLGIYASKADNIPSGGQTARTLEEGRELMGIPWMSWAALVEAIPPAYTTWIGVQLLTALDKQKAA